jgi:hypothetical protein
MAKLTGNVLVDRLCDRMAWSKAAASAQRLAAIRLLQEADDWFSALASHKHLERTDDLVLANNADTVAVPAWVDVGKSMQLDAPDGTDVDILPADKFRRETQYTYGAWGLTTPKVCTIRGAGATGVLSFVFSRTNGTGGNLTFKLTAQQLRTPLTDDGGSTLLIPETYETSIILTRAEHKGKGEIRAIVTDREREDFQGVVDAFLDQFRSTREVPKPDSEQVKRKQAEQLQEGR